MEIGILLVLAGLALYKAKSNDQNALEDLDIEAYEDDGEWNPFPSYENDGTPFDDQFFGYPEETGPYVNTPSMLDMMNPEQENFMYGDDGYAPAIQIVKNQDSPLGSAEDGNAPGYVDYGMFSPYQDPVADSRERISTYQRDYVEEEESVTQPSYYQTPVMPAAEPEPEPTSSIATKTSGFVAPQLLDSPEPEPVQSPILTRNYSAYTQPVSSPTPTTTPILTGFGLMPIRTWGM